MSSDALATPFTASVSALREHLARQQADRIIDQFATRFTEEDFFPEDGDTLLFAMLTQLPQWSADTEISIVDEDGEEIACYLKYNDASVIERTITLMQRDDGTYSALDQEPAVATESLFKLIFSQLPATSELGMGGDFPGSNSLEGRIVTLRAQVAALAQANRVMLFEAFLADAKAVKSNPHLLPNAFLPFWTESLGSPSITLAMLHVLYPQMPVERLEDLLRDLPLSDAEGSDLLHDETLPESFALALQTSLEECTSHRAIDGLLNTRTYDPDTDALARTLAKRLLSNDLGRELIILERDDAKYESFGENDTNIVLRHAGDGEYLREDLYTEQIRAPRKGTDSFYVNIGALLPLGEHVFLGMESENDVAGFRAVLANIAIAENGGWFAPETLEKVDSEFVPDWFRQASSADKLAWKGAVQDYSQAMVEAQAPELPDLASYGEPSQLRSYTRKKLRERLKVDHGLDLEPDEIVVETDHAEVSVSEVGSIGFGYVGSAERPELVVTTQVRGLIDLCLQNLSVTDFNFVPASRVLDKNGRAIRALTPSYIYALVRDLNVGEGYADFLRTRLLTSTEGQWSRERYARVMQAQMRLDALEAKMAGDFHSNGNLPPERKDRAYKWVTAVVNNPVDDDLRATVEGHKIVVGQVSINGVTLDGMLLIAVESRTSVASFVVYTPQAPDGKCFRELDSSEDLRENVFLNKDFLEYLVNLAPVTDRQKVRNALTVSLRNFTLSPVLHTDNFFETAYQAQVDRLIATVDEQTSSTWEKNWESAWEIASFVGETALLFTSFKVALPIAALRSLYAVTQGLRSAANGEQKAAWYFFEAALVLADALPGGKTSKIRPKGAGHSVVSAIDSKRALSKAPDNLKLRTDGHYNGIHELSHEGAPSTFYVKHAGETYTVRHDLEFSTWRLIDPRRPDAYYQMPIIYKEGNWIHARLGLLGGMPRGRRHGQEALLPPAAAVDAQAPGGSARVFRLNMTDYSSEKLFNKRQQGLKERLDESVIKITKDFEVDPGAHSFHPVEKIKREVIHESGVKEVVHEKLFTFDIPGMPSDGGRGAWRLKVREPHDSKGILVFHEVMRTHKSKH
jgi:hypothetical protein